MQRIERFRQSYLPEHFTWFNEPSRYRLGSGLDLWTDRETDFWQTTHYGFQRDNGHGLFARLEGDFCLTTHVTFRPASRYDQCGLMVRADGQNWIKVSAEYEDEDIARLGSVVTNLGYSDWATQDIPSAHTEMGYRISRNAEDFLLEHSYDGETWLQLRVTHLHRAKPILQAGLYACSPTGAGFWCRFDRLEVSENRWLQPEG